MLATTGKSSAEGGQGAPRKDAGKENDRKVFLGKQKDRRGHEGSTAKRFARRLRRYAQIREKEEENVNGEEN